MIWLLLFIGLVLTILLLTSYVIGFSRGSQTAQDDLLRVRLQAIDARRRLHEVVRHSFVALAEHAERTRQ